jgi:hypothetical protein
MCPLVVMSRKIQKIRNIAGIVQENEHLILSPVHALVCGSAPGGIYGSSRKRVLPISSTQSREEERAQNLNEISGWL